MSLASLTALSLINVYLLPALWDSTAATHLFQFIVGLVVGGFLSWLFIRGHTSVLIHEFKHAIISNLVGNKWKGMKIERDSGHFTYAHTKRAAEYNAFISLAPYWLPLFTLPMIAVSLTLFPHNHSLACFLIGLAYGGDCLLNFRDISPIQTDLTEIRGGYFVACFFVLVMNLALGSMLIAWILQRVFGLKFLLYGLWKISLHLVAYYRGLA